jgi:hypothetical protein
LQLFNSNFLLFPCRSSLVGIILPCLSFFAHTRTEGH